MSGRSAPDSELADFLAAELSLPSESRPILHRYLSPKFRLAVTGEMKDVREALAIGLLQLAAIAKEVNDKEYVKDLGEKLGISTEAIGTTEAAFSPGFYNENRAMVTAVYRALAIQERLIEEDMLKEAAKRFLIRISRHSLLNGRSFTTDQFSCEWKDKEKYFTVYIFLSNRKGAVLIPEKFRIASRSSEPTLKKGVYYSSRPQDPPKIDRSLHENHRVITELQRLVQNFTKPMLRYCVKLMGRIEETKATLQLTGGELSVARNSMRELVAGLEGADFGDGGEALLKQLKELLARVEVGEECNRCRDRMADIKLQCGHAFCARCVIGSLPEGCTDVKGDLRMRIPCPNVAGCVGGEITVKDIREMSEQFYQSTIAKAEDRCALRLCHLCERLNLLPSFEALRCGHFMCKFCLTRKYSTELTCPQCKMGVFKPDLSFEGASEKCAWCQQAFFYAHTLNYACISYGDCDYRTNHGVLCNNCMQHSLKFGRCCDYRQYSPEDLSYIMSSMTFPADCHQQPTAFRDLLNQTSCSHKICRDCVQMKELRACPTCAISFNQEALPVCAFCGKPPADVQLACEHFLHMGCVEPLVQKWEARNWVGCPTCGKYISPLFILPKIKRRVSAFSAFNNAFGYSFDFKCPLGGSTKRIELAERKADWIVCDCHKKKLCPLCLEAFSESPHACRYISLRENVDAMFESGKEVVQCPFCSYPEEQKDEAWHACGRCESYYAPCCAAKYEPIFFHGDSFHRPNCALFNRGAAILPNDNCSLCRQTQGQCPKPKQLHRPRLIGPGEGSR